MQVEYPTTLDTTGLINMKELECCFCGKMFFYHRRKKYCGVPCRNKAIYGSDRHKERKWIANQKRLGLWYFIGPKEAPIGARLTCLSCDAEFIKTRLGRVKYCSKACSDLVHCKARHAKTRGAVVVHKPSYTRVFERNNWRCQICGISTPPELRGTYIGNAPVADHIVPLAAGGDHDMDNLQCLCQSCNGLKGAALPHSRRLESPYKTMR